MTVTSLRFAASCAFLDDENGVGYLVPPLPCHDVPGIRGPSLQAADWDHSIRHLASLGWEPVEDEDGWPIIDGYTQDGRELVALRPPLPMQREAWDPVAESNAMAALARMADTVGT